MSNKETIKPTSYSEQQYLAFTRETEVLVTLENVRIIATPILEARLDKIQRNAFNGRETFEILEEINIISDELERRKTKGEEKIED